MDRRKVGTHVPMVDTGQWLRTPCPPIFASHSGMPFTSLSIRLRCAIFLLGTLPSLAYAQCGTVFSSFPYSEGFENGPAWASGGAGNDWAWGTPAHIVINGPGGGTKSWCVGGLTGAFYNNNERSWLESPCFDFTALARPRISFKIFWEVERQFDGMVFQYSTDGGATYHNVGTSTDVADCHTAHWFNSSNITNLPVTISPKHGWSGRIGPTQGSCQGGGGSAGWVTAKHCLAWLAHAPNVRFRFFFGAGSACNNYDGIAIDDILIDEAPQAVAAFSADCDGTTVDFQQASTPCPHQFAWNFGDPASPNNTSTQENPSHTYANPGTYTVSLAITDACGGTSTTTRQVSVLGVTITAVQPTCGQQNGTLEAVVTGASAPVDFHWSPGGATTPTLHALGPGTYTVSVSSPNSCGSSATATLTSSNSDLALSLVHTDVSCAGMNDGTAGAVATGGVAPVALAWLPGGNNAAQLSDLSPGTYTCTATDANGCTAEQQVTVLEPAPVVVAAMPDTAICEGQTALLHALAGGGHGGFIFNWTPAGPSVAPLATTTYAVTATDADGCSSLPDSVTVSVSSSFMPSFTVSDSVGCTPLCVTFQADPAGAGTYQWSFGDGGSSSEAAPAHCFNVGGSYVVSLTVVDDAGCAGSFTAPGSVLVHASPVVSFSASPPVTTIDEPTVHFINTSSHADQFLWSFGDPGQSTSNEASPRFTYGSVDCYTVGLVASNADGCSASGTGLVCVEDPFLLFTPNAFTPDHDNINDVFLPVSSVRTPRDFRLMVFDRWGAPVFSTTDAQAGWNGDGAPDGLYVWKLWITDALGAQHVRIGHVLLMR